MSVPKVGFVGLGNIGLPMARSIAVSKIPLTIYSRHQNVVTEMQSLGAAAAGSPQEMAAVSDIVISVVRDVPQTNEVIFGESGIWKSIKKETILVISSTVGPEYCQWLALKGQEKDVHIVDAAISKSGPANEEGKFTLLVGGADDAVKQCQAVFESLAINIFHLGDVGMGQTYKLVNQLAQRSTFAIVCECLNLGLIARLDLQKLVEVIQVSSGDCSQLLGLAHSLALKRPQTVTKGRDKGYVRDLIFELAKKADSPVPLFDRIISLDVESAYHTLQTHCAGLQNRAKKRAIRE